VVTLTVHSSEELEGANSIELGGDGRYLGIEGTYIEASIATFRPNNLDVSYKFRILVGIERADLG
jgi:hypothetical protein